jgi:hypothetical protein
MTIDAEGEDDDSLPVLGEETLDAREEVEVSSGAVLGTDLRGVRIGRA